MGVAEALQAALDRAAQGPTFELTPTPVETDAQRAEHLDAQRAAAADATPPLREQVHAAIQLDSGTYGLLRLGSDFQKYPVDPNYTPPTPDTKEFKDFAADVPPRYWDRLAGAHSAPHAEAIKQQILTELDAEDRLKEAGWSGAAVRLGTSILDPISLAAMIATGGESFAANAGSRIANATKLAAIGGAVNAGLEGINIATHETKDTEDLFKAFVHGAALGGAFGAALPATSRAKLYKLGKDISNGGNGPGDVANAVNVGLDEGLSAGAAQASRAPSDLLKEAPSPEILNTPQLGAEGGLAQKASAAVRFDWYGQLAKSDNPYVRYLGRLLLEDPVGVRGVAQEASAEEFASVLKRRALTQFYRDANPALAEHLDGVPMRDRRVKTDEFFEAVTDAVRKEDFSDTPVGRAAQAMRQAIRTTAEEAKRHGVKGFGELELADNYVPRIPNAEKIEQLVTKYGNPQIEGLLAQAFARGAGVSEDLAEKVARGYIKNVRMRGVGAHSDFFVKVADRDAFAGMMRDAGISDKEIDEVVKGLKAFGERDESQAGKIARAKRRLTLDESVFANLKDQGGNVSPVSVTDLFENDARILSRQYVNSVGGHAALARAGITSPAEWETATRNARLYAQDRLGMKTKDVDKEITKLEVAHSVLTGKPLVDYSDPVHALSYLARDWAYIAQSGSFGFAQASELGSVLTAGGFKLMADALPELRGMFKRAADGKLTNEFAREMEDFLAPGTEAILHSTASRFEGAYDAALVAQPHSLLEKTEGVRHNLRKVAGYASGLTPLTIGMQRLAARFVAQRIVNTAFGRGRGYSDVRLASMGLDGEMQQRVFKQIEEHAIQQAGSDGKNIPRLALDKWTDLDARDAFILAVNREHNRTVLTPTMGGAPFLPAIFRPDSELGKVLGQFMTFAMQSHSRLLLHGIHHADAERAVNWMAGLVLSGMAYAARTQLESSARADKQKFLHDRMTPGNIAASAFNMSGFSGLIPPLYDTTAKIVPGVPQVFSHSRTSGLGSGMTDLGNYPAGAMVKGAFDTASAFKDGKFTQSDFNNARRLFPYARVIGISQMLDALQTELPRSK